MAHLDSCPSDVLLGSVQVTKYLTPIGIRHLGVSRESSQLRLCSDGICDCTLAVSAGCGAGSCGRGRSCTKTSNFWPAVNVLGRACASPVARCFAAHAPLTSSACFWAKVLTFDPLIPSADVSHLQSIACLITKVSSRACDFARRLPASRTIGECVS